MTPLEQILKHLRDKSKSQRDKGDGFERLIQYYLKNDAKYQFKEVWLWREWAELKGIDARDVGIDIVGEEEKSGAIWAVQCKFYDEDTKIYKRHIDSFFTESGKAPFAHRLIVLSTSETSEHVHGAMKGQQIPCGTLNLKDLEESGIDWAKYKPCGKAAYKPKKKPMPHQEKAIAAALKGLAKGDRGKLLMACGTGKTFTSLKIAEEIAGTGGSVLFLVPSLALLSQALNEWTIDSVLPLNSFAVCSDAATGKKIDLDLADITLSDLAYPATTRPDKLAIKMEKRPKDKMTVVFSTYQSIQVVSEAQKKHGLTEFDLIICDEAHRTTGATLSDEDESNFVRVHDQGFIKAKKRIYMTATPKIFGEAVKARAEEVDATLCSMDDPRLFGETLFTINFSEAVQRGLLSDYKVLVLAVDEMHVSRSIQKLLTENASELRLDDASKIIGCWKALSKIGLKDDVSDDQQAMRRAVAFCKDIKTSERIAEYFPRVIEAYISHAENFEEDPLRCSVHHVDGTFNATRRKEKLDWLKAANRAEGNTCNILSNARCLTEGVDVPSLDGILFLNPRKSQIDIVQAVGRVMRKAEGKKRGYIILPIGIPAGVEAERALNDNERYRTVWQILQALRAHDDRFDAMINKIDLGADVTSKMEVVAVTDALKGERGAEADTDALGLGAEERGTTTEGEGAQEVRPVQTVLPLKIGELEKAIYAKIVKKCGNRQHWEDWAGDIAKIAQTHITRITAALKEPGTKERKAFDKFLKEIRDDLNESISEFEAIEMLAQHIITKPVFDALFEGYDFAAHNPVSVAMQKIVKLLDKQNLKNETTSLETFYASVKFRAQGINDATSKQKIIVELYDKFFRNAFPRLTDKLGIVYTPVEVVDFIIHSVNDVLKAEFGETLGSKGVHILDPFVGTGTFITRLMQSGLISPKELEHKYAEELHANEIVLLAYYIAAINIESVYHSITQKEYKPFNGICLTDTFQLYEKEDMFAELMVDNSNRRTRQKKLDIKVIIGNPPYSAGQGSGNDNNANVKYPHLDESIRTTYAAGTTSTLKNSLYDSYIRAIRWGTDRIGQSGVMAYVSNAGWLDGNAADGLRKCLAEEFTSIYVFHLRGNARSSGEMRRKERGNVFGEGTRTPIAISLFVKNPNAKGKGKIYFHDIGDYLSREEKLEKIKKFGDINGISENKAWQQIVPDKHHDWLRQRDDSFDRFISLGDKKDKSSTVVFGNYSSGIKTNRDPWCYNASRELVTSNMKKMISFYNNEVQRLSCHLCQPSANGNVIDLVDTNPKKIKWTREILEDLSRRVNHSFETSGIIQSIYRPFSKQWAYYNRHFNNCVYQMPKIFPNGEVKNRVIAVTGIGSTKDFSCLISDTLPDLEMISKSQCFPLKLYEEESDSNEQMLFKPKNQEGGYTVRDGITDEGLRHFKAAYPGEKINKEDIFYYIYGLLHSEEYKKRFADNLSKELPRIPCVKKAHDFWAFSKAGRKLGDLHVGYESVDPYPVYYENGIKSLKGLDEKDLRVEQMKFGKDKDKTTVIYNHKITMKGIPAEAYSYVVNGKPALEWVMERQCVSVHKESGIENDANRYAIETVGDPAYPLLLFQRVITVSLETMKIVRSLPKLDI